MFFTDLPIKSWLKIALKKNNFFKLTPIQEASFKFLNSRPFNAIIFAPTGTGKTLSYLLPILNNINDELKELQCLVILPTHELSWQTYENFKKITQFNEKIKIDLLTKQNVLNKTNHVLVSTLATIKNEINSSAINWKYLKMIVFDEADMLFDHTFISDVNNIFTKMKLSQKKIKKIFLSASLTVDQINFYKKIASPLKFIHTTKKLFTNDRIKHIVIYKKNNQHPLNTLKEFILSFETYFCIVFANKKEDVERIYQWLVKIKKSVTILHNELNQSLRKQVFHRLKNNEYKYLVCSDLMARGIDLPKVSDIISYDLPQKNLWYLHRCGRSARNKNFGRSFVIYCQENQKKIAKLNKHVKWDYWLLEQGKIRKINDENNFKYHVPLTNKQRKEIKKIYNNKNLKIKPGYKKKIKKLIFKIKQKSKRKYLNLKYQKIINKNKNEIQSKK